MNLLKLERKLNKSIKYNKYQLVVNVYRPLVCLLKYRYVVITVFNNPTCKMLQEDKVKYLFEMAGFFLGMRMF